MQRANVYIDGFNLFYGVLKGRPSLKWLDLAAFGRALLLPDQELQQVRYFTARVGGRAVDPHLPQRQDTYLRAGATLPAVSVHEGYFQTKPARLPLASSPAHEPEIVEVLRTEEKGSEPLRVVGSALGRTSGKPATRPRGRGELLSARSRGNAARMPAAGFDEQTSQRAGMSAQVGERSFRWDLDVS